MLENLMERRMSVYTGEVESSKDIMMNPPDWGTYIRAGGEQGLFLLDADVDLIHEYENQPDETVQELLDSEGNGTEYVFVLIKILNNVSNEKVVKYALTLIEDFLVPQLSKRADFFLKAVETDLLTGTASDRSKELEYHCEPFVKLLDNEDAFVHEKALHILCLLLSVRPAPISVVRDTLTWIIKQLHDESRALPGAIHCLSILLRNDTIKREFHQKDGLRILLSLTTSQAGKMQVLYEVSLCIWLLSLYGVAVPAFDHGALFSLVKLIQSEPREKVLRVAISTLRNILEHEDREKEVSEALIERGMLKILNALKDKRIKDEDILGDISEIAQKLNNNFRVLNTFERHEQELLTESMEWGTVHTEKFWKENVKKFEKNDFQSIKKLIKLVKSDEDVTAAIACNDIGYFVQYYPNGKKIVERLGGKKEVMMLLAHKQPDVQKQALLCCSKMMVTNWEFLRIGK